MIEIQHTLVHEDLVNEQFICHLEKCKGACCIEGDSGAPLNFEELAILDKIYDSVKPYMTDKGVYTVEKIGRYVKDFEGDYTTPCVDENKECVYVNVEQGIAKCAIEKAYEEGKIDWKKPVSCHLYPIRITQYPDFEVLSYDRWHICHDACSFGAQHQLPVFRFLKDALIRKYGELWFNELEQKATMK